jgi:hypothetical protein
MQFVDPAVIHAAAARGDDVYPYAEYRPLPEAATQPRIVPWSYILHTMAGPGTTTPDALWRYLNRTDVGGECHLLLGYSTLIQAVPFTVRADNNAKANQWMAGGERRGAVSVETQDNGSTSDPGIAKAPWNAYQVEHLAGTSAFLHLRYGNPLARCTAWDGRGVDGHRKFPEWSIYTGKTCPGETRWNQIPTVLALAAEIAAWTPNPTEAPIMQALTAPVRLIDTRPLGTVVAPEQRIPVTVAPGAPAWARSAVVNITATQCAGPGFVTAWAGDNARPNVSNVNYMTGQTVANLAVVPIAQDDTITVSPAAAGCHLIVDQQGWAA